MHPLHYAWAYHLNELWDLKNAVWKSPACTSAATQFIDTMTIVRGILIVPPHAFLAGNSHRVAIDQAVKELSQGYDLPNPLPKWMQAHLSSRIVELLMENAAEVDKDPSIFNRAVNNFQAIFAHSNPFVYDSVENILKSAIILSWTAFEVLAHDFVFSVIKVHPRSFLHLTGNEKFRFQKRQVLRESYEKAFGNDLVINQTLGNRCLDEHSLLRNLIIHKATTVDQIFRDDCVAVTKFPFSTPANTARLLEWSQKPIGFVFQIDGKLVHSLLTPLILAVRQLLDVVDNWIINHP
jgi:hypothetical protein